MKRHVYNPPRGTGSRIFAFLAGLAATAGVFVAIPLSQRLSDIFQAAPDFVPEDVSVDPPEFQEFDVEEPPPEEQEAPPEEFLEEPANLDLGLEVADLPTGTGGGFVLDFTGFDVAGAVGEMMESAMDSPPQPAAKFPPSYPPSALRSKKEGKVMIACVIDPKGKIVSTSIRKSSGHPELDNAALAAVRRWKFKPGTKGGKKVDSTCLVPFTFRIKK